MIFPIVRHATNEIVFSVTTAAITGTSMMGPWSSDAAEPREVVVPRNRRERRARKASKRHKKLIRAKARIARSR